MSSDNSSPPVSWQASDVPVSSTANKRYPWQTVEWRVLKPKVKWQGKSIYADSKQQQPDIYSVAWSSRDADSVNKQ